MDLSNRTKVKILKDIIDKNKDIEILIFELNPKVKYNHKYDDYKFAKDWNTFIDKGGDINTLLNDINLGNLTLDLHNIKNFPNQILLLF